MKTNIVNFEDIFLKMENDNMYSLTGYNNVPTNHDLKKNSQVVDNVVALVGKLNRATFHFPCEYLANFCYLETKNLEKYKLFIGSGDEKQLEWKRQWVSVILPELSDSILDPKSSYFIKNCLLFSDMINKLIRFHVDTEKKVIFLKSKINNHLSHFKKKQSSLLLLKRKSNRRGTLENFSEIENECKKYCKINNLFFDVFDDNYSLGDVTSQLLRFRSAKVIVGQHGAGLTNLLSCEDSSRVIEFKEEGGYYGMYYKISNILKLKHDVMSVESSKINLKKFAVKLYGNN